MVIDCDATKLTITWDLLALLEREAEHATTMTPGERAGMKEHKRQWELQMAEELPAKKARRDRKAISLSPSPAHEHIENFMTGGDFEGIGDTEEADYAVAPQQQSPRYDDGGHEPHAFTTFEQLLKASDGLDWLANDGLAEDGQQAQHNMEPHEAEQPPPAEDRRLLLESQPLEESNGVENGASVSAPTQPKRRFLLRDADKILAVAIECQHCPCKSWTKALDYKHAAAVYGGALFATSIYKCDEVLTKSGTSLSTTHCS